MAATVALAVVELSKRGGWRGFVQAPAGTTPEQRAARGRIQRGGLGGSLGEATRTMRGVLGAKRRAGEVAPGAWCCQMRQFHAVQPGLSWGSLLPQDRLKWASFQCDNLVRDSCGSPAQTSRPQVAAQSIIHTDESPAAPTLSWSYLLGPNPERSPYGPVSRMTCVCGCSESTEGSSTVRCAFSHSEEARVCVIEHAFL